MPTLTTTVTPLGGAAPEALFGGNILAPRAHMTGPASYAHAIEELGVTDLRYPGGSLTETMFDLRNPDADQAIDPDTGKLVDFIPLSDVMDYAAETGRGVSIVIPTRDQLSATNFDGNGDRMPAIDREVLSDFIRDVVSGEYGAGTVTAFEIGNEYWGSGEMTAAEYGRLAADMAEIVDRVLNDMAADYPMAAEIDVLVQVGTNFGSSDLSLDYAGMDPDAVLEDLNDAHGLDLGEDVIFPNGTLDWTEINNEILLSHFDDSALQATDGVIAHVYSRAPEVMHSRWFQLEQIEEHWLARDPTLEIHVTEWNQKSNTESLDGSTDYGLWQAQEMLEQIEEFMRMEVDAAQVWPLIQNTDSTLAYGREFDEATVPGEMFAMMSENLPGMRMLDFTPSGEDRDTELTTPEMDVHAFADGADMVLFFTSNLEDGVVDAEVDIANLVDGFDSMEITVLGVADGYAPGNTQSPAEVSHPDPEDLHVDGLIETVLAPGEIMMVRINGVDPTEDFAETFAETGMDVDLVVDVPDQQGDGGMFDGAGVPDFIAAGGLTPGTGAGTDLGTGADEAPADDVVDDLPDHEARAPSDDDGDGGGSAGMDSMWMLGLLPLLFLLG